MIDLLFFMIGIPTVGHSYRYIDPCEQSINHLSSDKQVEMAIGCSYVNGIRVYKDSFLWKIINEQ